LDPYPPHMGRATTQLQELRGERLLLRPARLEDLEALAAIVAEPDVAPWWGSMDAEAVRAFMDEHESYVIEVEGEVAGWLHVHEDDDPDYPSVAFDVSVTMRRRGGGYGREALRLAIDHFVARGHHRFTIDPAVENERAIRAYERVGFKPVGVLREYERAPDGRWRDGLLMDLLARDLAD
jgi:aminoglycoside 6'-N-acetyltransferase